MTPLYVFDPSRLVRRMRTRRAAVVPSLWSEATRGELRARHSFSYGTSPSARPQPSASRACRSSSAAAGSASTVRASMTTIR